MSCGCYSHQDSDLLTAEGTPGAGIPGFDDKYIPRVVGAAGGALILANHFLGSAGGVQAAQERAEVLGLVLAVMGWLAPTLEQRLKCAPGLPISVHFSLNCFLQIDALPSCHHEVTQ